MRRKRTEKEVMKKENRITCSTARGKRKQEAETADNN